MGDNVVITVALSGGITQDHSGGQIRLPYPKVLKPNIKTFIHGIVCLFGRIGFVPLNRSACTIR
jgi:hypothetical protein